MGTRTDPADEDAYCASLVEIAEAIAAAAGRRADFGLSVVALHHIASESMRACAFRFLASALRPEPSAASFMLAEWDNKDGALEVWFDVQGHAWGGPGGKLPAHPEALKLWPDTNYSDITTFSAQLREAGFVHDAALQAAAAQKAPLELADSMFNRNFEAYYVPAS